MPDRPVLVEVDRLGSAFSGNMQRLTMSDARILPNMAMLIGTNVQVRVRFSFTGLEYTLSGATIESHDDDSFSLRFDSVTRERLVALSTGWKGAGLLQSSESGATPATSVIVNSRKPTKADAPGARRARPAGSKERRASIRHLLEVGAVLSIVNSEIVLKCGLLDLSFGGCRLRTKHPGDYEAGTPVEVEFTGHGQPFRLAAHIRTTDDNAVGLEFSAMSTRIARRLTELIGELGPESRLSP